MKVLQILPPEAEIVCLICLPCGLDCRQYPGYYEYKHPSVRGICPCLKVNGVYKDLRTGKIVEKTGDTLEWSETPGTVFQYPDGYETLISRRISDRKVIIVDDQEFSFNNRSMVRIHVH